jgi:hypothetical protein
MIHIEKDQAIAENENIKVLSPTGDYNDTDLIEYYSVEEPEVAQGAYHAQFIKYGGIVYRFNDPKELGAEILKIEPESTHTAASFVRMQNELSKQFDQGSLESNSLNEVLETEQVRMDEEINNNLKNNESENTETDSSDLNLGDSQDDTVSEVVDSNNTSTTTPPIIPDLSVDDLSTSTPEVFLPDNNSTSTANILQPESLESEATSTAAEIISYAKKQINKKITKKIKSKFLG